MRGKASNASISKSSRSTVHEDICEVTDKATEYYIIEHSIQLIIDGKPQEAPYSIDYENLLPYGLGLALFFRFLKHLTIITFICTLISIPA